MSINKQLLDPLGTVCKLITINFNEIRTKIGIHNHVIVLQKPHSYQFVQRMYNGDSKENIADLYHVITQIITWYIQPMFQTPEYEDYVATDNAILISRSESIRKIVKYLCDALKKLQRTYTCGNVIFALQYYILILENSLNGRFDESQLPEIILENTSDVDSLLDYNKLKNLWTVDQLNQICKIFDDCFQLINDAKVSNEIREVMIRNHMRGITGVLDITDSQFKLLISNISKG